MQLLESAMAFAVTMIVFSTITTGIVELLLRLLGTRERNLEKTIRVLFQTVIWPRMKAPLMASAKTAEEALEERLGGEFVKAMMGNPLSAVTDPRFSARKENQVSELSILAFAERLGRTDIGKAILDEGEAQLELLVNDFVRTFDRFARASQEVFRKRAQQTAMAVGVVFAVTANVDAGRLLFTLMDNPDLRTTLIDQAEGMAQANDAVTRRLADLSAKLDEGGFGDEESEKIQANIEEITTNIEALETKIDTSGLPVGQRFYPYCGDGAVGDPRCTKGGFNWNPVSKLIKWLLLTVVAGILIGLGGPFWFRVFSSLSQVFQVLKSLGIGKAPKSRQAGTPADAEPEPGESARPKSVVDAFKVAVRVHAYQTGPGQRAVLSPDGQPL